MFILQEMNNHETTIEVMNFASLTEKSFKIQHKAVSQYQRKYMAQKHAID